MVQTLFTCFTWRTNVNQDPRSNLSYRFARSPTIQALSEDMYDDGYHNIVNIDFSGTVIRNMAEKCRDRVGMECKGSINSVSTFLDHWPLVEALT